MLLFTKKDPNTGEDIYHILDHVGMQYQVADMIEEVRAHGLSRKTHENFPFDKLDPFKSKIWLCHSQAWIRRMTDTFETWECQKKLVAHMPDYMRENTPELCCSGGWYQNIRDAVPYVKTDVIDLFPRPVERTLEGGHTYIGSASPEDCELEYNEAVFLVLPITNISVPEYGAESRRVVQKIREKSDIPVLETEA